MHITSPDGNTLLVQTTFSSSDPATNLVRVAFTPIGFFRTLFAKLKLLRLPTPKVSLAVGEDSVSVEIKKNGGLAFVGYVFVKRGPGVITVELPRKTFLSKYKIRIKMEELYH